MEVLVVDDNRVTRQLLCHILNRDDHTDGAVSRVLAAGAGACLEKPFSMDQILEALRRYGPGE